MLSIRRITSLPCLRNARFFAAQGDSHLEAKDKGKVQTHTGQTYEADDYRNVRFTNSAKIVNQNWAINLIAEQPIIKSNSRVVACTGGDEHLGHPKVYINLDKPGSHACGYCGLRYEKEDHHH